MKSRLTFLFLFLSFLTRGQVENGIQLKKLKLQDSVQIDSVSINPFKFEVLNKQQQPIDTSFYRVDFRLARIYFTPDYQKNNDSIYISYKKYPDFLTKKYQQFDPSIIVNSSQKRAISYTLESPAAAKNYNPFEGLSTTGSISRGITVGTNQSAVLNSELDLQIVGEIAPGVSLRASLQDANIPLQQQGYAQNLSEFDQVFIELESKNWKVRAGDVDLIENQSFFAAYRKKVQGINLQANLSSQNDHQIRAQASAALVQGVYTQNEFIAQEGNQGPYKLTGPNNEVFVLIISGSERVFVNGNLLSRGENEDYTIDYTAGEIIFNPTFPITSEMRIRVEFQYTEQNYSRIIATAGGDYQSEKWQISGFVYHETDLKNQPLQQNLNREQVDQLAQAGDNQENMFIASAQESNFSENKVLYTKTQINGKEVFVYSNNPEEDLFQVKFTLVGPNQGDYILASNSAISKIYSYVAPINGIKQGNYAPIIRLYAPERLQLAMTKAQYSDKKTAMNVEIAASKKDLNLFSAQDDQDNAGLALKAEGKQLLKTFANKAQFFIQQDLTYIENSFSPIERIYAIEFDRDWNLENQKGNQIFNRSGFKYIDSTSHETEYWFEHLNYKNNYSGNRHVFSTQNRFNRFKITGNASYLNSQSQYEKTKFLKAYLDLNLQINKWYTGTRIATEHLKEQNKLSDELALNSQAFQSSTVYVGVGDSTGVFTEIGFKLRTNDSIRNNRLSHVNTAYNYYLKGNVLKQENSQLSFFANYRKLKYTNSIPAENSLNAQIRYRQNFANRFIQSNTLYQTNSGTLAQQEFTYVEVNPGEGQFIWIDYNQNGTQELDEFEISPFPNEGKYVRVLLPNQIFIKTNQNKISQVLTLDGSRINQQEKVAFWHHFYNQTSYLLERKIRRASGKFNLNPFQQDHEELGANINFRNSLFYNRGKQKHSTTYTYLDATNKNFLITGVQESKIRSHQINYLHRIAAVWLLGFEQQLSKNENSYQNFPSRNFNINNLRIFPKVTYLLDQNKRFELFYELDIQENVINNLETLQKQRLGLSLQWAKGQIYSFSTEFNYIYNAFKGDAFSPVGYQMLSGLQPKTNYTWKLLAQKKITNYLDLNLNYQGRKSPNNAAIHTGNVQLRAYF